MVCVLRQEWHRPGEYHDPGDSRRGCRVNKCPMMSQRHPTACNSFNAAARHQDKAWDDFRFGLLVLADSWHPAPGWSIPRWPWFPLQRVLEFSNFRRGQNVWAEAGIYRNMYRNLMESQWNLMESISLYNMQSLQGHHVIMTFPAGRCWFRSKRRRYQSILTYLKDLIEKEPHRTIYVPCQLAYAFLVLHHNYFTHGMWKHRLVRFVMICLHIKCTWWYFVYFMLSDVMRIHTRIVGL